MFIKFFIKYAGLFLDLILKNIIPIISVTALLEIYKYHNLQEIFQTKQTNKKKDILKIIKFLISFLYPSL